MTEKPLIVFEGIDHSGKTTVANKLAQKIPGFIFRHEPDFSSEEADMLNSPEFKGNDAKREVYFLESRLRCQEVYRSNSVILDRYLWTGMAYAKTFAPNSYNFTVELYQNYNIFKKPTLTFFMNTPVQTCFDRKEPSSKETYERLDTIYKAYMDTKQYVNTPIVMVDGTMGVDDCVQFCYEQMTIFCRKYIEWPFTGC